MQIPAEKMIIAKTGAGDSEWLPLHMHLKDTAGITDHLIADFLSESFASSCGLEKNIMLRTAHFLAYVHDIGKATDSFQYKISLKLPERRTRLEALSLSETYYEDDFNKIPHSFAGEAILKYYGCPEGIAAVVGAHHGAPAEKDEIFDLNDDIKDFPYECFWGHSSNRKIYEEIWESIISDALEESEFSSVSELPELTKRAQMLLTGLLITADWIASNTDFFPLLNVDDDGFCDEAAYQTRVINAWDKAGFTEKWEPCKYIYSDKDFYNSFGFYPSSVQRAVLDIIQQVKEPGLFIFEAPMGCGKTEAALSSAELLASKCGKDGLFFGLPTQATANGIFPRIMNWAENQSDEFYHTIQLKHGSAELNDRFAEIQRGIPDVQSDSGLIVHNWFCDGKKACLSSFVTATVDHFLMSALKRRHVMLLHLGLSEKVVIIDEVHAYDAYMNRYLERALQWLGAYHTPVILLSATLPGKRREALLKAYLNTKKLPDEYGRKDGYPLLTWTDSEKIEQNILPYEGEHKKLTVRTGNCDCISDEIKRTVSAGGCAGIIVNTVSRAQKIAAQLRESGIEKVILCHAQFTFPDRSEKENKLLETVGKNSDPVRRAGAVIVGTQVLEQSLDIDFDLLITDICPMDLLLQRTGRLHRHKRDDRPDGLKEPLCIVLTDEAEDKGSGSAAIYGEWLLSKTLSELPGEIFLPDDISVLVQKVYNAFDDSDAYAEYLEKNKSKESGAGAFLLSSPKGSDMHGLLIRSIAGSDEKAEASVRDGISSVEVLLMQKTSGSVLHIFGSNEPLSEPLSDEQARKIASERLRLPSRFCQDWSADKTIYELEKKCGSFVNAQRSHWLKGKLVMFFDENFESELMGYKFRYSFENGLEYFKKEECE